MKTEHQQAAAAETHLYLLGHPPLRDYLSFMSSQPVDAATLDLKQLTSQWRQANDRVESLEKTEPQAAIDVPVAPVTAAHAAALAEVQASAIFQKAFAFVPIEVGVVELDRLIVTQKTINLTHVERIKAQLGPQPSPAQVFDLCLPRTLPVAGHRVGRIPNGFVFVSEANDLRFLEAVCLTPERVADYHATGAVAGIVGLVIGYSSNYLNVVAAERRLVLSNGYHRAYALRDLGVQQAPCVIQKVTRGEELDLVGTGALRRTPELYLQAPRPPLLRDFFDPPFRMLVRLTPKARQVRVTYTIEELSAPLVAGT